MQPVLPEVTCPATRGPADTFWKSPDFFAITYDTFCTQPVCSPTKGCIQVPLPDGTRSPWFDAAQSEVWDPIDQTRAECRNGALVDPCSSQNNACQTCVSEFFPDYGWGGGATWNCRCHGPYVSSAGQVIKCDDGNPCTLDDKCAYLGMDMVKIKGGYMPGPGDCVGTAAPSGAACDDGKPCTDKDACDGKSTCAGTAKADGTACDDGKPCTDKDACKAGVCTGTAKPKGAACEDGDPCTIGETCSSGFCVGAKPKCPSINSKNTCEVHVCLPWSGECVAKPHSQIPDQSWPCSDPAPANCAVGGYFKCEAGACKCMW